MDFDPSKVKNVQSFQENVQTRGKHHTLQLDERMLYQGNGQHSPANRQQSQTRGTARKKAR